MKELNTFRQYLTEGVIKEEVDVLGNEFTQEIQDDMKMYYKMDVDMDDIKDWVNMYYIGYNSEYDEGPGDVDYEGNEFGSEDYESEKKELVFDTAEREDFYMHLNPEADSTFPNLKEDARTRAEEEGFLDGEDVEKKKMKVSELKAKIKETILAELSLSEADEEVDVDIDVEDEVEVEAGADDIEIERKGVKAKVEVGLSPEEEIIQDSLKAAMDAADALGNDKLSDQIGNTITFFTREYVVGDR